jgi:hypothetical protein
LQFTSEDFTAKSFSYFLRRNLQNEQVVLINDTSMALELRFDIPFGVSSTV